ncbi:hypothetical protein [Actinoplanes couchii]|uniref:hypothetical protein n=1 Tax=Actinoplanes couchii TaxID=403638 RepID=UPI0019458951|nr:hypothetical protein [Actinoplanes couchii]MDR6326333.1 hypothetical protein [Actinoplanes couchii]
MAGEHLPGRVRIDLAAPTSRVLPDLGATTLRRPSTACAGRHLTGPLRHLTRTGLALLHLTGTSLALRHLSGTGLTLRHLTGPTRARLHLVRTARSLRHLARHALARRHLAWHAGLAGRHLTGGRALSGRVRAPAATALLIELTRAGRHLTGRRTTGRHLTGRDRTGLQLAGSDRSGRKLPVRNRRRRHHTGTLPRRHLLAGNAGRATLAHAGRHRSRRPRSRMLTRTHRPGRAGTLTGRTGGSPGRRTGVGLATLRLVELLRLTGEREVVVGDVVGARSGAPRLADPALAGTGTRADGAPVLLGRAQVVEPAGLLAGDLLGNDRRLGTTSTPEAPAGLPTLLVARTRVVVGPIGTPPCHRCSSPALSPLSSSLTFRSADSPSAARRPVVFCPAGRSPDVAPAPPTGSDGSLPATSTLSATVM